MFASILLVTLFAVLTSFFFTLPYKFLMNQEEAKSLRAKINNLNAQVKEEQKKKNTEQTSKLLNQMMGEQSKVMRMTTKPMMVTLLLVILVLPFFAGQFVTTAPLGENQTTVTLNALSVHVQQNGTRAQITPEGSTALVFTEGEPRIEQIGNKQYYIIYKAEESGLFGKTPSKIEFDEIVAKLLFSIPFTGENAGWLAWYILVSIPANILFRKLLGINV